MITEERITKAILKWLKKNSWEIISFDFPQSGTGIILHENFSNKYGNKNKGSIIPDIICVKNETCLFFENKDRFYKMDFIKQNTLKTNNTYTDSINSLLSNYCINKILYGIGMPYEPNNLGIDKEKYLVDFVVMVKENNEIYLFYDPNRILN